MRVLLTLPGLLFLVWLSSLPLASLAQQQDTSAMPDSNTPKPKAQSASPGSSSANKQRTDKQNKTGQSLKPFKPSDQIRADDAVSFPVDI